MKLTLTDRQAGIIYEACELFARIRIGQIDEAIRRLPDGHPARSDLDRHRHCAGPGIAQRPEDARIAWDIYQVIRHHEAWKYAVRRGFIESTDSPRNWDKMTTVWYDDPLQIGDEPLPKVEE